MALGAARSVYLLILKEAGLLSIVGIVAGILCASRPQPSSANSSSASNTWDIQTLAAVAILLGISALLASFIPARRAASINPVEALRAEQPSPRSARSTA